jgi:hypothetical protein
MRMCSVSLTSHSNAMASSCRRSFTSAKMPVPRWRATFPRSRRANCTSVRQEGQRILLRGGNGRHAFHGQHKPWSGEIDIARTFLDSDGDGLPDLTETILGTDPRKTDTDGDGVPDGEDSNPAAAPATTEAARAQGEAIRYIMEFVDGADRTESNPPKLATIRGEMKLAAQVPGGRYLHWPAARPGEAWRQFIGAQLRVSDVQVNEDKARVEVAWSPGSRGNTQILSLRKLGGVWRVTDAKITNDWIE